MSLNEERWPIESWQILRAISIPLRFDWTVGDWLVMSNARAYRLDEKVEGIMKRSMKLKKFGRTGRETDTSTFLPVTPKGRVRAVLL